MTRDDAKGSVLALVERFSADDVKDWLAEACETQMHKEADAQIADAWLITALRLHAIANEGV